jgi:hypothetical protein
MGETDFAQSQSSQACQQTIEQYERIPGGTFLCVTHLRQEPYAVIPHVRICAGARG